MSGLEIENAGVLIGAGEWQLVVPEQRCQEASAEPSVSQPFLTTLGSNAGSLDVRSLQRSERFVHAIAHIPWIPFPRPTDD